MSKKSYPLGFLLVGLFLGGQGLGCSNTNDLTARLEAAKAHHDAGKFGFAVAAYRDALAAVQRAEGDPVMEAMARTGLAEALVHEQKFAEAEPLYRAAIETFGPTTPRGLAAREALTTLYDVTGRSAEAVRELRAIIASLPAGENWPTSSASPTSLGFIKGVASPLRQARARSNLNLGVALFAQGKKEEARVQLLNTRSLVVDAYGADHHMVATVDDALGTCASSAGRPAEALTLYRSGLALRKGSLGDGHPSVATSLYNLAGALDDVGELEEAAVTVAAAVAVRDEAGQRTHSRTLQALRRQIAILKKLGRDAEAGRAKADLARRLDEKPADPSR